MMVNGWLVQGWPHSRALGERWVAFPMMGVPSDEKWPGLKLFKTEVGAVEYCNRTTTVVGR